jgi:uncharacterized protein YdeI (YjbR/CyaY-like superfamily)
MPSPPKKPGRSLRDVYPRFEPRHRADWRRWLSRKHASSTGVWLVFRKGELRQITYADAVEEALCFGWIDSTLNPQDEERYLQLFTPRKATSGWSRLNKGRIERLQRDGLMMPAGLAAIETAKQNGSWERFDQIESLAVPPELAAAFRKHPKARANFDALRPFSKKMYLYRINGAKRPETRAVRVVAAIAALEKNWTHPMGPAVRTTSPARPRTRPAPARGARRG